MAGSTPKYGPPYQPPTGDGSGDSGAAPPNVGDGDVPNVAVVAPWSSPGPPSFNDDPPAPPAGSGDQPTSIPDIPGYSVNLASLRGGMNTLIADAETLVSAYEDLRSTVFGGKDTVFGQTATVTSVNDSDQGAAQAAGGSSGDGNPGDVTNPSPIQKTALEFAASLNPAQLAALEAAANAIELVGQFIAGVDRAGQTYGATDRAALFASPPGNPVSAQPSTTGHS